MDIAARVSRRRWLRPAVGAALILGGVLGVASPAFAHAQLLGTSPASGAVLTSPPAHVVLTFGEAVQAPPTAIEVFSAAGQQLRTGPAGHPPGRPDQVEVTLPSSLHGTYVVSWRVISADTHPVQGAFDFSVGAATAGGTVGALEQHLLAARHPSSALGTLVGALRTLILLAVLVTLGTVGLLVRWPAGLGRTELRALLLGGSLLTAAASVATVLAQGPYDAGKPLGRAWRSNVLSPVLHSSFGTGAVVRVGSSLVILVGVLGGMVSQRKVRRGRPGWRRGRRVGPVPPPGWWFRWRDVPGWSCRSAFRATPRPAAGNRSDFWSTWRTSPARRSGSGGLSPWPWCSAAAPRFRTPRNSGWSCAASRLSRSGPSV